MFEAILNVLMLAALMAIGGMVFVAVGMFVVEALGLKDD